MSCFILGIGTMLKNNYFLFPLLLLISKPTVAALVITSNINITVVKIPTVAVGNTGNGDAVLVSDNKLSNWVNITPAIQGVQLNAVASSGTDDNLFVAVGNQGDVQFSHDGVGKIWNKASLPDEIANFDLSSVAYGNHAFVATAFSGDSNGSRILSSTDGGANWGISLTTPDQTLFSIAYVHGEYVAFGNQRLYFTKDLNDGWSSQELTFDDDSVVSLTYGNGQFVGVGNGMGYGLIYQSQDGISWTSKQDSYPIDWSGIAFAYGLFFATSQSGHVYMSQDGADWTDKGALTASLNSMAL